MKNTVLKVTFETAGIERKLAHEMLKSAAKAFETSPDMPSGFAALDVIRRVHIEEDDKQTLIVSFGVK